MFDLIDCQPPNAANRCQLPNSLSTSSLFRHKPKYGSMCPSCIYFCVRYFSVPCRFPVGKYIGLELVGSLATDSVTNGP